MEKFMVTFVPINHRLWGERMRFLGEVDKFCLNELPIQNLLALKDEPKESFSKALQNLLHEIGTNLAKRLMTSSLYCLCPFEDLMQKWICVHSPAYWYTLWAETSFLASVSNAWTDVATDEGFAKNLIETLQEKPLTKEKTLWLYGILVYARTLFEQKGGNWNSISP